MRGTQSVTSKLAQLLGKQNGRDSRVVGDPDRIDLDTPAMKLIGRTRASGWYIGDQFQMDRLACDSSRLAGRVPKLESQTRRFQAGRSPETLVSACRGYRAHASRHMAVFAMPDDPMMPPR